MSLKMSKVLRHKALEFLMSRKNSENLMEILKHFESGSDMHACVLSLELIFVNLLRQNALYIEIVPLKTVESNDENNYKQWLRANYENTWIKLLGCLENPSDKLQLQALSSCFNLLAAEGKHPLEIKTNLESYLPINRLKLMLMKVLSSKQHGGTIISKFEEYFVYDDVLFSIWKALPSLTAKSNPNDVYILNYLMLLEKLPFKPIPTPEGIKLLCFSEKIPFNYDEQIVKRCLNKIWNCMVLWEHNQSTHKQLLIVLLEKLLPHLDKPLLLTDFLMDSLDVGGPVSLLALQGVFTLIQEYNLEYPNIFAKLYSMFEPEIFHTKFKARLFYLSDIFLSSTHLPENLVAAFAKRLARLALIAPSEDIMVICMFIGNLILRHPGLKCLLNHPAGSSTGNDPYIMEERDPLKSNAINSSLWEILSLQQHALPCVATAARFISNPLPSVEWDLGNVLDTTVDTIFDREIKKNGKLLALAFEKDFAGKCDKIEQYWKF
ncbi:nucleolar complex protein 4 homolog B [Onthophagus taurus]|uniref:nucleolar complex protein 4 homolog B n=1 Tax=Onthophagus taurus TaxID=166361 RepID=UPI000C20F556|nr:nucleolar complex protein 4 homolog B [Onthophagus taurus]